MSNLFFGRDTVKTELVKITPAMALSLLEKNSVNRPMSSRLARVYAHDMQHGKWQLNGETIKIAADGTLLDGQHRLAAVVLFDKPVEMMVVRGLANEAFATIDTGMKRSAAQILGMADVSNASVVAAACRWINIIKGTAIAAQVTSQDIFETMELHPNVTHFASKYSVKGVRALMPSGCVAALTLASEKYGIDVVDDFLNRFESGVDLKKTDPVYELRERLIASKSRVAKLRTEVMIAITIKAIRAFATGKTIGVLRWSSAEVWPEI